MKQEIERKFLVVGDFRRQAVSSSHIMQGYLCSDNGITVRVRVRDEKGYLTIKGPSNKAGLGRSEFEKEISLSEAQDLMHLCRSGFIDKRRYLVPMGKHTFEVDEFYGNNEGLIMAEVELEAEDEPYLRPDFIGKEVTGDRRFYNSHLLQLPFCLWGKAYLEQVSLKAE